MSYAAVYALRMVISSLLRRAGLVFGMLALPCVAEATIIVPRTVDQMSVEAASVVRAKVVARQSAWDKDHRRIHTYTELVVLEAVTGTPNRNLVVRTMGGEVGDIGMRVSGVARFEVGEEVVVFLRHDPLDASQFQVIGMSQGKYRVDRSGVSATVHASTEGLAFARRGVEGKLRVDENKAPELRTLDALLAQVRRAAAKPASNVTPAPNKAPALPAVANPSGAIVPSVTAD